MQLRKQNKTKQKTQPNQKVEDPNRHFSKDTQMAKRST